MVEQLKIASWNVEDGLSKPNKTAGVVERIKTIDADIVALPEAFAESARYSKNNYSAVLQEAFEKLAAQGYVPHSKLYDDTDGRKDRHGFVLLTRQQAAADEVVEIDLGSRQALGQYMGDISLTIAGVHLDDRTEVRRMSQTSMLLRWLNPARPNVVMGDMNAMHRQDLMARALRLFTTAAYRLPSVDPGEQAPNLAWLRRKGSLSQRLTDMATGYVIATMEESGYRDADPVHQPTKGAVQLDHIMANTHTLPDYKSWLSISQTQVEDMVKGESDHRPISTTICY